MLTRHVMVGKRSTIPVIFRAFLFTSALLSLSISSLSRADEPNEADLRELIERFSDAGEDEAALKLGNAVASAAVPSDAIKDIFQILHRRVETQTNFSRDFELLFYLDRQFSEPIPIGETKLYISDFAFDLIGQMIDQAAIGKSKHAEKVLGVLFTNNLEFFESKEASRAGLERHMLIRLFDRALTPDHVRLFLSVVDQGFGAKDRRKAAKQWESGIVQSLENEAPQTMEMVKLLQDAQQENWKSIEFGDAKISNRQSLRSRIENNPENHSPAQTANELAHEIRVSEEETTSSELKEIAQSLIQPRPAPQESYAFVERYLRILSHLVTMMGTSVPDSEHKSLEFLIPKTLEGLATLAIEGKEGASWARHMIDRLVESPNQGAFAESKLHYKYLRDAIVSASNHDIQAAERAHSLFISESHRRFLHDLWFQSDSKILGSNEFQGTFHEAIERQYANLPERLLVESLLAVEEFWAGRDGTAKLTPVESSFWEKLRDETADNIRIQIVEHPGTETPGLMFWARRNRSGSFGVRWEKWPITVIVPFKQGRRFHFLVFHSQRIAKSTASLIRDMNQFPNAGNEIVRWAEGEYLRIAGPPRRFKSFAKAFDYAMKTNPITGRKGPDYLRRQSLFGLYQFSREDGYVILYVEEPSKRPEALDRLHVSGRVQDQPEQWDQRYSARTYPEAVARIHLFFPRLAARLRSTPMSSVSDPFGVDERLKRLYDVIGAMQEISGTEPFALELHEARALQLKSILTNLKEAYALLEKQNYEKYGGKKEFVDAYLHRLLPHSVRSASGDSPPTEIYAEARETETLLKSVITDLKGLHEEGKGEFTFQDPDAAMQVRRRNFNPELATARYREWLIQKYPDQVKAINETKPGEISGLDNYFNNYAVEAGEKFGVDLLRLYAFQALGFAVPILQTELAQEHAYPVIADARNKIAAKRPIGRPLRHRAWQVLAKYSPGMPTNYQNALQAISAGKAKPRHLRVLATYELRRGRRGGK